MIKNISKRIKKELSLFKNLNTNAREVIISNTLHGAGSVLTGIFINAYIFLSSERNISTLILFNMLTYSGIYLAFIINGYLLRKLKVNQVYIFGVSLEGITPLLIVLTGNFLGANSSLIFGLLGGLGSGFYWANRNYLEIDSTNDKNRDYFYGMNLALGTIIKMIIPIVTGYFIVSVDNLFPENNNISYIIIMIIGFLVYFWSAYILRNNNFKQPLINDVFLKNIPKKWKLIRSSAFFNSFDSAVNVVLITVLILNYVGDESALGTIETIGSILTLIGGYVIGRKIKAKYRIPALFFTIIISAIAVGVLNIYLTTFGVLVYIFINNFTKPIKNNLTVPIWYKSIDDLAKKEKNNYSYILDLELFINLGRICLLIIFLLFLKYIPEELTIRIILIVSLVAQMIDALILKKHNFSK